MTPGDTPASASLAVTKGLGGLILVALALVCVPSTMTAQNWEGRQ